MSQELIQPNEQNNSSVEQAPQREWVEPTFERLTLKDAMAGFSGFGYDGALSYS